MKKRFILFAVLLSIGLSILLVSSALAEPSGVDGNITWSISDEGVLTISGSGPMKDYFYDDDCYRYGYSHTGQTMDPAPWFGYEYSKINIVEGVTSIGSYAFSFSPATHITIPDSVSHIGSYAFYSYGYFQEIHISSLGSWLTINCDDDYSRPNRIHNCQLFLNNIELTSIEIPNGITSIPDHAFDGFYKITSITIPDSVTSIGNFAFTNCNGLHSLTIPNKVTKLGDDCFSYTGLQSITVPESVTSIGRGIFGGCWLLETINFQNHITSINDGMFLGCESLENFIIPESVNSIGEFAFSNCDLTNITIPDSVTTIGRGAFCTCTSLSSIIIGKSVTSIGEEAFENCSSLTSVTIPNSVTSIGKWAFCGCSGLTSVTIPDSVTSIGDNIFYYCSSDPIIKVFPDSYALEYAIENNIPYEITFDLEGLNILYLPSDLKTIETESFSGLACEAVIIPDGCKTIGDKAFENCTELLYVYIPSSVTTIGDNAFNGCDNAFLDYQNE